MEVNGKDDDDDEDEQGYYIVTEERATNCPSDGNLDLKEVRLFI